jgi:hypothetical protein
MTFDNETTQRKKLDVNKLILVWKRENEKSKSIRCMEASSKIF